MKIENSFDQKRDLAILNPGKDPAEIKNVKVYAFISTETSVEELLTTIRMIRLSEEEKIIYKLFQRQLTSEAISIELKMPEITVKKMLLDVHRKLML